MFHIVEEYPEKFSFGYFGKDLVINEFIYDSFLFITLGCFGIAAIGQIFGKKNNKGE